MVFGLWPLRFVGIVVLVAVLAEFAGSNSVYADTAQPWAAMPEPESAWAVSYRQESFVALILSESSASSVTAISATFGGRNGRSESWSRKSAGKVLLLRSNTPQPPPTSVRVRCGEWTGDVPLHVVSEGAASQEVVPHERRYGRECVEFVEAVIDRMLGDNGVLRAHAGKTVERFRRWGKIALLRVLWDCQEPDSCRFLARVLSENMPHSRRFAGLIEYAGFGCRGVRRLSMRQAEVAQAIIDKRVQGIRLGTPERQGEGQTEEIERWFRRRYEHDVLAIGQVMDGALGEYLYRRGVGNRRCLPKPLRPFSPSPPGRLVLSNGRGGAASKGRKTERGEKNWWRSPGEADPEKPAGGTGTVHVSDIVGNADGKVVVHVASQTPLTGWKATVADSGVPVRIERVMRRTRNLAFLILSVPAKWTGSLKLWASGCGARHVIVTCYENLDEVRAFSEVGLRFLCSRDSRVRLFASKFARKGTDWALAEALLKAEGDERDILNRMLICTVGTWWDIEEFASDWGLGLAESNNVFSVGVRFLRKEIDLHQLRQGLRPLLQKDAAASAVRHLREWQSRP